MGQLYLYPVCHHTLKVLVSCHWLEVKHKPKICLQNYSLKSSVLCFLAENANTFDFKSFSNALTPVKMKWQQLQTSLEGDSSAHRSSKGTLQCTRSAKRNTAVTFPAFLKWSCISFTYSTSNLRAAPLQKAAHNSHSHLSGHRIYTPLRSPSLVKPQSSSVLDLTLLSSASKDRENKRY